MGSVLVRDLSEDTKEVLKARARRAGHSLEEELRRILNAAAIADSGSPDTLEPFGDWFVEITRPGYQDFADNLAALRKAPDRALPDFE